MKPTITTTHTFSVRRHQSLGISSTKKDPAGSLVLNSFLKLKNQPYLTSVNSLHVRPQPCFQSSQLVGVCVKRLSRSPDRATPSRQFSAPAESEPSTEIPRIPFPRRVSARSPNVARPSFVGVYPANSPRSITPTRAVLSIDSSFNSVRQQK